MHAFITAAAVASPGVLATIWAAIVSNLTETFLLATLLPLALGLLSKYLSAQRKAQIGEAVSVAFHALDGVDSMISAGGAKNVVDKIDQVLKSANDYMQANGWKALTPSQSLVAIAQIKALAGKASLAGALAPTASVPVPR